MVGDFAAKYIKLPNAILNITTTFFFVEKLSWELILYCIYKFYTPKCLQSYQVCYHMTIWKKWGEVMMRGWNKTKVFLFSPFPLTPTPIFFKWSYDSIPDIITNILEYITCKYNKKRPLRKKTKKNPPLPPFTPSAISFKWSYDSIPDTITNILDYRTCKCNKKWALRIFFCKTSSFRWKLSKLTSALGLPIFF